MILTLHRRYPEGECWEVDPASMGDLKIEKGRVHLEMRDCPIKLQIQKVLSRPITYLGGLHSDEGEEMSLKVIDRDSDEYGKALVFELRRLGIEAREKALVAV